MTGREKYNKLDDIGFIGEQVYRSKAVQAYYEKKTGEAIRLLKEESQRQNKKTNSAR